MGQTELDRVESAIRKRGTAVEETVPPRSRVTVSLPANPQTWIAIGAVVTAIGSWFRPAPDMSAAEDALRKAREEAEVARRERDAARKELERAQADTTRIVERLNGHSFQLHQLRLQVEQVETDRIRSRPHRRPVEP